MKNLSLFTAALIFVIFYSAAKAQTNLSTRTFDGTTYYKVGDNWSLFDSGQQQFVMLSKNVVSILFQNNTSQSSITALQEKYNLTLDRKASTGWADFSFPNSSDLLAKCDSLLAEASVKHVEVTSPLVYHLWPNDSVFQDPTTGNVLQWDFPKTKIDLAWNYTTGDTNTIVAFIDTGGIGGNRNLYKQLVQAKAHFGTTTVKMHG